MSTVFLRNRVLLVGVTLPLFLLAVLFSTAGFCGVQKQDAAAVKTMAADHSCCHGPSKEDAVPADSHSDCTCLHSAAVIPENLKPTVERLPADPVYKMFGPDIFLGFENSSGLISSRHPAQDKLLQTAGNAHFISVRSLLI